jgi:hypothetical protein
MGLTLGCARCHNHKYDPLLQKDFYSMFAFFNSLPELGRGMKYGNTPPLMQAPTPEQQAQMDALEHKIAAAQAVLQARESEIRQKQAVWERSLTASRWGPKRGLVYMTAPEPIVFDGKKVMEAGNAAPFDISDPFTVSVWVYSDTTPDGSLASCMVDNPTGKGYGVHLNKGHVHVNLTSVWADDAVRVESEEELSAGAWHHIAVTVDGSRLATGVAATIDGKAAHLRIENATLYRPFRNAGNALKEPFRVGGGWGPERRFKGQMQDLRVYSRVLEPAELQALDASASLSEIAKKPVASRTSGEAIAIRSAFLETDATGKSLSELKQELEMLRRSLPTVMVMQDLPQPRQAFILERGAYDKPGAKVERAVPGVLPPLAADAPRNRLGLAEWLVDGKNPLTARVEVNRLWQNIFGTGLVKTAEDFGVQGEAPSHPELLDWLATQFVRSGWDVKAMVRLMVTSATYRQASTGTPELVAKDPENRLLARGPRFRLPAEAIRDQALFASGLMTERIGGPSVMPYQPEGLWKETAMQDMNYTQAHGPDLYRRGLYTFWKRTIAPPMMAAFDAAGRETCVVRESRTDTPMQALDLMNDVTFIEAGRALGQRMVKEGGSDPASRLRYGFRLLLSRYPSVEENRMLLDSLNYHRDYFASRPEAASKLLAQGERKADPSIAPGELAAYASVASLILNLDEAVTKQ